jgi:N-acetylmuramoyl-L-alanine amidase
MKVDNFMNKLLGLTTIAAIMILGTKMGQSVAASEQRLFVAYPPDNHQTTADSIFLIGTAAPNAPVFVNGKPIQQRSRAGHFAPSFPLKMGENLFTLRYKNQEIQIKVTRISQQPELPSGIAFAKNSLTPAENISRLPGELICLGAIAPKDATVSVKLGSQIIPLLPQKQSVQLPPNSAVLTAKNQPITTPLAGQYQGCTTRTEVGYLGYPLFQLSLNNQTITQAGTGTVEILNPAELEVREVTANLGIARTGPSTDYSRLTPLPQGTIAAVTGKEGDWLRLDYGGWINQKETQVVAKAIPPQSLIRSISSRQLEGATEIIFPLQIPVPINVKQSDRTLTLTLYNTTAQTDTIYLDGDPIIQRLDWQQINSKQVEYTFHFKSDQQWGYDLKYEGTSLILSLRHPPKLLRNNPQSLEGITILIDPGHGGQEFGARGPTGYPEKEVTLIVSKLLAKELIERGAKVYLTRDRDRDVSLPARVEQINQIRPTLALSIHYNALPDGGDAINTSGVSTFWYHPQAHNLATFLENYLVKKLTRPSYGVFWNNLALTRPQIAPSVLLELGFIINPEEFEWITNLQEQEKLAKTLADGIGAWFWQNSGNR